MRINRRKAMGLVAAAAAASPLATPQPPPLQNPDALLQAARASLKMDCQRIATIDIPRTTEPATRFRA